MAYVLLRGSRLSSEDKKRVLVESGAGGASKTLEWSKVVAAIRMLGSSFFQKYTGAKREKTQKTYDHMACATDVVGEDEREEDIYRSLSGFFSPYSSTLMCGPSTSWFRDVTLSRQQPSGFSPM